jgi:hypothetical protein
LERGNNGAEIEMFGLAWRILTSPLLLSLAILVVGGAAAGMGWIENRDLDLIESKGVQAEAYLDGGTVETKRRSGRKVMKFDIHWDDTAGTRHTYQGLQVSSQLAGTFVQGDMIVRETFPIKFVKDGERMIVEPVDDIVMDRGFANMMFQYGGGAAGVGLLGLLIFGFLKLRKADLRLTE